MKRELRYGFVLWILLLSTFSSVGQINASLDKKEIKLGERVTLTVEVKEKGARNLRVTLPGSMHHWEVLESREPVYQNTGDGEVLKQSWTLTSFDTGRWTIPPIAVRVGGKMLTSDELWLEVKSVELTTADYHDIKDIIEVKDTGGLPWYFWVSAAVLLILLWLWWRSRKKPVVVATPVEKLLPPGTAYERFRKEWGELRNSSPQGPVQIKQYYTGLHGLLRRYLQERFSMPAVAETTDDVLIEMKRLESTSKVIADIAAVLRLSDAVKFAQYLPPLEEHKNSADVLLTAVDHLEEMNRMP